MSVAPLPPHPNLPAFYRGRAKQEYVRAAFDRGAAGYDRVERAMAFGTGSWYRRQALLRAGMTAGARVLDVAVGTGLVAREAAAIVGPAGRVIGLDPSAGMLAEARRRVGILLVRGVGERLPLADASVDFVSMGYALRHVADLHSLFAEFARVLRPGGRVCVLELTRPAGRLSLALLRLYLRTVVPTLTWVLTAGDNSRELWRYYWETIETCLPPESVLTALSDAGFERVVRHVEVGMFSEYVGSRPG